MTAKKRDHYENVNTIRRILLEERDPIGVCGVEEATDTMATSPRFTS
jgi:hypothetical protein